MPYKAKQYWITTLMLVAVVGVSITESANMRSTKSNGSEGGGGNGNGRQRPSITTYDQRQTGKYNIHVNIKDVKIISVDGDKFDGEFGDDTIYDYGDYDYDPSHLTVNPLPIFGGSTKPPKSTTKAPVSITSTKPTTSKTTTESATEDPSNKPATGSAEDLFVMEAIPSKPNNSSHMMTATGTTTPPSSNIYIFKPTPNYHPNPIHYDYQEIPVEVIVEPVLKPKYRNSNARIVPNRRNRYRKNSPARNPMDSMARHSHSDIEALPSSAQNDSTHLEAAPCPKGEYHDRTGKCRMRKSGISRLIKLLASFKEKDD
ncbi:uncharacterized protein LOC131431844 isoform X2 [Malaya genurostris]|uniref:uncharacterized protein LOC131431844 isoform X2 n=1 Tax=Malaya genurostris TaxID=325434 RepID=UPI0026F395F1|nr:uncharacterized protein LOC131431844 isoform X2 [Malaya genurostris]